MKHIVAQPVHTSFPIAIVVSEFNRDITHALRNGAVEELNKRGFASTDITLVEVPGAIEIPVVLQQLARLQRFPVIIALGAVIRGETAHFDYVCQQVSHGCQQVALECGTPVIFKILTTDNEQQAWDRVGGTHGHMGREAVECAVAMYSIMNQLNRLAL